MGQSVAVVSVWFERELLKCQESSEVSHKQSVRGMKTQCRITVKCPCIVESQYKVTDSRALTEVFHQVSEC
jgi:hypothetical protein